MHSGFDATVVAAIVKIKGTIEVYRSLFPMRVNFACFPIEFLFGKTHILRTKQFKTGEAHAVNDYKQISLIRNI